MKQLETDFIDSRQRRLSSFSAAGEKVQKK
jgi:hypothetical protein